MVLKDNVKNKISNFLGRISKKTQVDVDIQDIVSGIEKYMDLEGYKLKLYRESIDGWKSVSDGYMRKDYIFSVNLDDKDYLNTILITLLADPVNYQTKEINAYFTR